MDKKFVHILYPLIVLDFLYSLHPYTNSSSICMRYNQINLHHSEIVKHVGSFLCIMQFPCRKKPLLFYLASLAAIIFRSYSGIELISKLDRKNWLFRWCLYPLIIFMLKSIKPIFFSK